jgi:O-antigen biosynthesis protein
VIGLINNYIEVITPGWLTEMTSYALRPEIGCIGAKLDEKKATNGIGTSFCGLV